MEIALIENGNITRVGDYRDVFPNTSFTSDGPDDAFLVENGAKRVNRFKSYDHLTEQLVTVAPYVEGDWVYTVEVQPMSAELLQALKDSAMAQIRATRNQLLSACDWTQLVDTPTAIKTAWSTYRQTLRDLPATITEPRTFNDWPHDPNWVERP
jgi:hypothetical protein